MPKETFYSCVLWKTVVSSNVVITTQSILTWNIIQKCLLSTYIYTSNFPLPSVWTFKSCKLCYKNVDRQKFWRNSAIFIILDTFGESVVCFLFFNYFLLHSTAQADDSENVWKLFSDERTFNFIDFGVSKKLLNKKLSTRFLPEKHPVYKAKNCGRPILCSSISILKKWDFHFQAYLHEMKKVMWAWKTASTVERKISCEKFVWKSNLIKYAKLESVFVKIITEWWRSAA